MSTMISHRYENAPIDLVLLIEQRATVRLVKRANHRIFGAEYWGACPFCGGGEDRFHVWPESERPHYWCRVCGAEGSPAWFLVQYCNYSFGEALAELGLADRDQLSGQERPIRPIDPGAPPCKEWQAMAQDLVARAEHYLWHPNAPQEAKEALAYLRRRGLSDETIRRARLGYVPLQGGRWFVSPFTAWGIDPQALTEEQRAKGGIRVPNGILIPWFEGDTLWKLAIKRPGEKMDYGQVMGSGEGLYGIDTLELGKPCMMVEGEFDALSVLQEAGDLVGCVATGSAGRGRLKRWQGELAALPLFVLQSFDKDEAGEAGAAYWESVLAPHIMRWAPWADEGEVLRFKDPNDMLRYREEFRAFTGIDLREWVRLGCEAAEWDVLRRAEQCEREITGAETAISGGSGSVLAGLSDMTDRTCCKCNAPAEHASPGGDLYCAACYMCHRGHPPYWQQDRSGAWLCSCVVAALPNINEGITAQATPDLTLPANEGEYWQRTRRKLEKEGYYRVVERERPALLARIRCYQEEWRSSPS